jgi:transcriptional regulator with XRE-family HTH domain
VATLRQLREQRHLTQEQLAVAAEVSTSTVYHIEAGRVRPRPAIVRRLARVLAVTPSDIDVSSVANGAKADGEAMKH